MIIEDLTDFPTFKVTLDANHPVTSEMQSAVQEVGIPPIQLSDVKAWRQEFYLDDIHLNATEHAALARVLTWLVEKMLASSPKDQTDVRAPSVRVLEEVNKLASS